MENLKKALNATTAVVFVVAFLLGYGGSSPIINRRAKDPPQKKENTPKTTAGVELRVFLRFSIIDA